LTRVPELARRRRRRGQEERELQIGSTRRRTEEVAENIVCSVECECGLVPVPTALPSRDYFSSVATLNTQAHFGKRRALSDLAKQF
jgi:hypothetical protein